MGHVRHHAAARGSNRAGDRRAGGGDGGRRHRRRDLRRSRLADLRLHGAPAGGFDHAGAIREFAAAAAARPGLNEAHHWLGLVLFHVSMLDEAIARFERALRLNPDDHIAFVHLGFTRYLAGEFDLALTMAEDAMRRSFDHWACYQVALTQLALGLIDEAERTVTLASRHFPGDVLTYPVRGLIAARRGDSRGAQDQIALTVRNQKAYGHYHHAQYDVACIHALLGNTGDALEWLGAAARNGFPCHTFFELDPLLERVRDEPRFQTLVTELRRECDGYRALYRSLTGSGTSLTP